MNPNIIVISSPQSVRSEIRKLVELFELGLEQFHVRKPDFTDFDMMNYLSQIPERYRARLVLHSHYHLAESFHLKGIQVGKNRLKEGLPYQGEFQYFGYSAHTFEEIEEHQQIFSHFFISPVFDSISKENYRSGFDVSELSDFLAKHSQLNIIALGGIDNQSIKAIKNIGFKGFAVLGTIWQSENPSEVFSTLKETLQEREYVLSIAGFDPSSGAGITADIKTFEQHQVQGLGVVSSITFQNESEFEGLEPLAFASIQQQIELLFRKYKIEVAKIGLIDSFQVLQQTVRLLKKHNPKIRIVWDSILKASAGFEFHSDMEQENILSLLQEVDLLTPNLLECQQIFKTTNVKDLQAIIRQNSICNILLKGGHSEGDIATDILITAKSISQFSEKKHPFTKHGTGCVLSTAIASNLAKGLSLESSIERAKAYISRFINSNQGLLGYHT